MSTFIVQGGKRLKGEIHPQGAKNEALQVICATLLTSEKITIHNIPDIRDVVILINLLKSLGVEIEKLSDTSYSFKAEKIDLEYLKQPDYRKRAASLRGSVMIIG